MPCFICSNFAASHCRGKVRKIKTTKMEEKNVKTDAPTPQVEEVEVVTPAEGGAEHTPRELLYERIRTKRPDAKYDDDEEEYYRQTMSMLDELEAKSGEYDKMSDKIMSRFRQNPDEAEAFLDYLDGASLPAAIRRRMGDEALTMKEGDEGWDEYVKACEERTKQFDENRKALDKYMEDVKESDAAFTEFVKERGMNDEDAKKFQEVVVSIANDMAAGRISKDTLALLKRATDYDSDVAGAREQGKIDGKNEKIDIESKRMKGSGLPDANAGGTAAEEIVEPDDNATAAWLRGRKFHK